MSEYIIQNRVAQMHGTKSTSNLAKSIVNGTIGCFANKHFQYSCPDLLIVIHALGQCIMALTCQYVSEIQADENATFDIVINKFMDSRLSKEISSNIIKISTDSLIMRNCPNGFSEKVNMLLSRFFERCHNTEVHELSLRHQFTTDFIVSFTKTHFYYRDQATGKIIGPDKHIITIVRDIMYHNLPLNCSEHYSNIRLAVVYMYDWCDRNMTHVQPAASKIHYFKQLLERQSCNSQFTLDITNINNTTELSSIVKFYINTRANKDYIIENLSQINTLFSSGGSGLNIERELKFMCSLLYRSIKKN